jgi:Uma2 family endonuclease
MRAEPAEERIWTAAEYLAWERAAPEKHAFYRGEIFAMAGASREHNLLVANIVRLLGNALLERPCETYPSHMRVKVPATGLYTYPDASVVSGEPQFEDTAFDTLLNPLVLVEVLSESTERYDRGEKFESYRTIPSLRDYVLITQERALVEHFARQPDGSWLLREHRAGGAVELGSIGCALAVDELYRKVLG